MLQTFSDAASAASPRRVLNLPKWSFISVQAIGGGCRIGSNQFELTQSAIAGAQDGMHLNPSASNTDVFQTWWIGELWVQVDAPGSAVLIIVPGSGHHMPMAGGM